MHDTSLKDIYPLWLQYRQLEVSLTTLEKNIRSWKRFFASSYIVSVPLRDLTRFELKAFVTSLVRQHPMTRHYYNSEIKSILNSLLDYAVELDAVDINRFRSVKMHSKLFKPKQLKDDMEDVFTLKEECKIMDLAEDDAWISGTAVPLGICILFCTGIRVGELCALKWGDIDGNTLTIQRMQVARKELVEGDVKTSGYSIVEHTKTSAGYRKVVLPDAALHYFESVRLLNNSEGISCKPEDFIFRRTNRYVKVQNDDLANTRVFDARLRKYCRQLQLPYTKSPHDIRRTYISLLLESGMNVDTVRKLAGHENIEMTLAYCRNRMPADVLKAEVDRIFREFA